MAAQGPCSACGKLTPLVVNTNSRNGLRAQARWCCSTECVTAIEAEEEMREVMQPPFVRRDGVPIRPSGMTVSELADYINSQTSSRRIDETDFEFQKRILQEAQLSDRAERAKADKARTEMRIPPALDLDYHDNLDTLKDALKKYGVPKR